MALRKIRLSNDPILRKKSKEITDINERIKTLLEDMIDTMKEEEGVGLAAPQVGILRRAVVIDIGDGPIRLINPKIIEADGEVVDVEGCLSVPGRSGTVKRPEWVKVKYLDIHGEEKTIEESGLMARVICHEIDHLEGILYIDKMIEEVELVEEEENDN